jgi:hypothetical protein
VLATTRVFAYSTTMQTVLYVAGLGDVIRAIYLSASYKFLSETTVPVPIILASHNPFTLEIFRFHPNARNFIIYELAHKYEEFLGAGLRGAEINRALCEFAGVDYGQLVRGRIEGFVPEFSAPDNVDSSGHIVFQPFAGNSQDRTLPEDLSLKIAEALRAQPRRVFIITRSYIRRGHTGRVIHGEENARRYEGGNITVLDNLSVPASLNLIKSASAYIGSWSSLHQAAWCENKPVAVFYPVDYVDVRERNGYAFGIDRENCYHAEYPAADMTKLTQWLEKHP